MKEHHEEPRAPRELRADGAANGATEESSQARGLSQTMRDPARRKRSASRPNGHGSASSSLTESPNGTKTNGKLDGPSQGRESAASDDATGTTFAGDAASSAAACTGRDACAEVAAPRSRSSAVRGEESGTDDDRRPRACDDLASPPPKKRKKSSGQIRPRAKESAEKKEYPPGTGEPLALDAPGFVEQMHERVNLYEVYKTLLTTGDLKVQQRATEFLMEMKYGKGSAANEEEAPRIDFGDLPRPQR